MVDVLLDISLTQHRVLGPDGGLVVCVVTRREGGLPENQQRRLIPEPDDESSRSVGFCREVGG